MAWAGGFHAAPSSQHRDTHRTRVFSQSRTLYDIGFPIRVLDNTMSDQTEVLHTVVVYFRFAGDDLTAIYSIEEALTTALADSQAGRYDGHEIDLIDGDDAYLFLVGPDADRLFAAARPVLESSALLRGARVTLRHGGPDDESAPERVVTLI